MRTMVRSVGTLSAMALLSGCGVAAPWGDPEPGSVAAPESLQFRAVIEAVQPGAVDEPEPLPGAEATDLDGVWERVGEEAAELARDLTAPAVYPDDIKALAPFAGLTVDEVALLPVSVRLYVPAIGCDQLTVVDGELDPSVETVLCEPATGESDTGEPGAGDQEPAKLHLGSSELDGDDIAHAESAPDEYSVGHHVVQITFADDAVSIWTELTERQSGERIAIVFAAEVVSAPTVQGPISEGVVVIAGGFTADEATELARAVNGTGD